MPRAAVCDFCRMTVQVIIALVFTVKYMLVLVQIVAAPLDG